MPKVPVHENTDRHPSVPVTMGKAAEDLANTNETLQLCADFTHGITHLRVDRWAGVNDGRLDAVDAAFQPDGFQNDVFQTEERIVIAAAGGHWDARQIADACVAAWADFLRHGHRLL
jgi:hypothetical protein